MSTTNSHFYKNFTNKGFKIKFWNIIVDFLSKCLYNNIKAFIGERVSDEKNVTHNVNKTEYKTILTPGMTSEMYIISGLSFRIIVSFIISEKSVISVARHSFPRDPGAFSRLQFFCFLPACSPNALPTAAPDGAYAAVSILLRSIETARLPKRRS